MSVNFGELIRNKEIKFSVTPHSTFSNDLHARNFFGYLFNTSSKYINERSVINAYYKPGENVLLKNEAINSNLNKETLKKVAEFGFDNIENIVIYNNILEYCMLNGIDTKAEILQILKDFAEFAIYALELEAFVCGYHFNQEEPHLHIVYKAKAKKKEPEENSNEDEDL